MCVIRDDRLVRRWKARAKRLGSRARRHEYRGAPRSEANSRAAHAIRDRPMTRRYTAADGDRKGPSATQSPRPDDRDPRRARAASAAAARGGRRAPGRDAAGGRREAWEREPEAEAGFFGRALLEGDAVIGWMHVAAVALSCRAPAACRPARPRRTPTCSPAPTSTTRNTCAASRFLLQEIEASLKHRRVAALEAFGLRRLRLGDPFRRLPPRAQPVPSRRCWRAAASGSCRSRATWRATASTWRPLVEAPRHSRAWESVERRRGPRRSPSERRRPADAAV